MVSCFIARSEADVVNAIKGIYPLVLQYQSALRLREAVPENGQRLSSRKRCTSRNYDFILNDAPEYQHLVITRVFIEAVCLALFSKSCRNVISIQRGTHRSCSLCSAGRQYQCDERMQPGGALF